VGFKSYYVLSGRTPLNACSFLETNDCGTLDVDMLLHVFLFKKWVGGNGGYLASAGQDGIFDE